MFAYVNENKEQELLGDVSLVEKETGMIRHFMLSYEPEPIYQDGSEHMHANEVRLGKKFLQCLRVNIGFFCVEFKGHSIEPRALSLFYLCIIVQIRLLTYIKLFNCS